MTLYVVTEGEYSDYHIVGIYSTKEQAELVKKYRSGLYEYPDIEEWELDANIPKDISEIREYYRVTYYPKQYGEGVWECKKYTKHVDPDRRQFLDSPQWNFGYGWGYAFNIDIPCDLVKDEGHALKIAKDKRAELIAMRKGIT